MALDVKKFFNEDLPATLARNAADAKAIGAKFQMNITGEGEWFVDVSSSGPSVTSGSGPADTTFTISGHDYQKLMESPQVNGTKLYFAGKLKVAGNQMLGMRLAKVFALK